LAKGGGKVIGSATPHCRLGCASILISGGLDKETSSGNTRAIVISFHREQITMARVQRQVVRAQHGHAAPAHCAHPANEKDEHGSLPRITAIWRHRNWYLKPIP
jgi:hypothetical protein